MLLDSHNIPTGTTIDTDVLIVGASPTGVTVAPELIGRELRIFAYVDSAWEARNLVVLALAIAIVSHIAEAAPRPVELQPRAGRRVPAGSVLSNVS